MGEFARSSSWRRTLAPLLVGIVALGTVFATAAPAQAESVWAAGDGVIINVQTGAKNGSTHQQWVSSIYIQVGTGANQSYGCGRFESWTQGFYSTAERCETASWAINRWVSTGNYVCGAFDDFGGWPRRIACIAINV
ncbi:hypothetical protein OG439_27415 [Amycolatopsis sp. NBC_01307]|uniref:hypothetical protein n=1 Tax=Amycolatopsis sp. NBC_01307 TaxID=2903561 RepID=UPI002E0D96EB|nr:hypothetical protein OG439_27415 [Amycolatopsis sp. NBC_01307]